MQIGFWNVNGWNVNENSENFKVRHSCLSYINIDILAVAETHLRGNEELSVAGYTWFGQNRLNIHRNAKNGSGGVGLLVKDTFARYYNIQVLDNSFEGIFWINFKRISDGSVVNLCVCYLPREGSSRYINVDE